MAVQCDRSHPDKTILVIEDDELNLKLVRVLLTKANYQVSEARDAELGLKLAREHHPDLILMDVQLPGMDGLRATRIIKGDPLLKTIPVIALTSYAMEGDEERAIQAGCEDYIAKPIDTRSFLMKISGYLKDRPGETPKSEKETNHKSRILIVDDEPLNVKLLAAHLQKDQYEIIRSYNGEDALKKAAAQSPDLILLDIMMPGIGGYDVTRILKNDPKTRDIPIILVTVLGETEAKVKGLEVGADEFLNKPVNTAELMARIQSLLRLKQYREQLQTRAQSEHAFKSPVPPKKAVESTKSIPSLLLVEDDEKDARLIREYLRGFPCRLTSVSDGEKTISRAKDGNIDLILLDLVLPGMDGFEVCRRLKERDQTRNTQILMLTCLSDLSSKIKGLDIGADDFLVKPANRYELMARVRALLKKKAYLDQLSSNYETALQSAITDKLTGLHNHAYFKHFLELEIKRAKRQRHPLALILFDIDRFKQYNDTFGHLEGDRILRELGQLIKSQFREVDLAARYGGEEFAVVLPYVNESQAVKIAERFRQVVNEHFDGASPGKALTVSMGVAVAHLTGSNDVDDLIEKADRALYQAKGAGKNQVCICEYSSESG